MDRRDLFKGFAAATLVTLAAPPSQGAAMPAEKPVDLFVKDWGSGVPLVFVHSWAVSNEIWQYQHAHFLEAGFRVVAYDRRGHGRSEVPGEGYDVDTLADDLARVIESRDLSGVTLIGHSMGACEIVRYLARHGSRRVARIVLAAPTTPFLLKTADNPEGIDGTLFKSIWAAWRRDFPGWIAANVNPFFVPETSQALRDWGIGELTRTPLHVVLACNKMLVETDFRADCRAVTVPTLVIQGTKDASAPLSLTGQRTAALIPGAKLSVVDGAPHGLMFTHAGRLNAEIAAFVRG